MLVGFDGGGGHEKNGFKGGGGSKENIVGLKGAHQKIPSNFAVTAFVIMQKTYQNAKNYPASRVSFDLP